MPNHLGWGSVHYSHILRVCTFDIDYYPYALFYGSILCLAIAASFVFYIKIYLALKNSKLAQKMIKNDGRNERNLADGNWNHNSSDFNSCTLSGTTSTRKDASQNSLVEETKMVAVTFRIFLLFFLCWAPGAILIIGKFEDLVPAWVYMYASVLAHTNSTLNFFIYFIQNDLFWKELMKMVKPNKVHTITSGK